MATVSVTIKLRSCCNGKTWKAAATVKQRKMLQWKIGTVSATRKLRSCSIEKTAIVAAKEKEGKLLQWKITVAAVRKYR